MTTNQQLKTHCEDVIANPQDHLDWVVDMARVALSSLEAVPVVVRCRYHPTPQCDGKWIYIPQAEYIKDETGKYQEQALFTAPPAAELEPIDLTSCRNLWYDHDDLSAEVKCIPVKDIKKAIRAAGYEVKS